MRVVGVWVILSSVLFFVVGCDAASNTAVAQSASAIDTRDTSGVTIEEIANVTIPGNASYNDLWGYADAESGTYLIFVGGEKGLAIVDVADPEHPATLSVIGMPSSQWHDMTVYDHYLYIVTEDKAAFTAETPSGLQIVDFTDPRNPLVTFWHGSFRTAHTIYAEIDSARLYVAGSDKGMVVLDISDPANPKELGVFTDVYVHEVYVRNGIAYTSEFYNGTVGVLNVSDPRQITTRAREPTPWGATHSTWLTQDGAYLLTADEAHELDRAARRYLRREGGVAIYTNLTSQDNLQLVNKLVVKDGTVHQIHVRGRYLIASWYTEGVVIFDIADVRNVQLIASYDTSPLPSTYDGFGGAWGVWPYDPRQMYLYVSDKERGLVILKVTGLR